jgi:hypothetical protein
MINTQLMCSSCRLNRVLRTQDRNRAQTLRDLRGYSLSMYGTKLNFPPYHFTARITYTVGCEKKSLWQSRNFPLFRNPKVHYYVNRIPQLFPTLSQLNPHVLAPCFFTAHFNIILTSRTNCCEVQEL